MARRNYHSNNKRHKSRSGGPRAAAQTAAPVVVEQKLPVQYGKPFVLLEDTTKSTFEYKSGAWIPYAMSIAECRRSCRVKELPQKLKGMTRYEVRSPMPESA